MAACLSLSGFHKTPLQKWKQSKIAEDSSNVVLQSQSKQLEMKIKSVACTEQVKPAREDQIEENAKDASGVKVARLQKQSLRMH
jgi:hypothetical protein